MANSVLEEMSLERLNAEMMSSMPLRAKFLSTMTIFKCEIDLSLHIHAYMIDDFIDGIARIRNDIYGACVIRCRNIQKHLVLILLG